MISYGVMSLRRSPSNGFFDNKKYHLEYKKSPRCQLHKPCISMGPVVASIILFVLQRFCTRLVSGQILRKGIPRKIRRMIKMMMENDVIADVFSECIEDLLNHYMGGGI